MTRIREWLNEPTQTRRKWTLGVTVTLAALSFGAVYGGVKYMQDQQAESRREVAEAAYDNDVTRYEIALDERTRCVAAVESRDQFRQMLIQTEATFAGFVEVVEAFARNPDSPVIAGLRAEVDEFHALIESDWPAKDLADCPAEPTVPSPP